MAKTSTFRQFEKKLEKLDFPQSYLGIIIGAIIVIVLGLLIANFLTRNKGGQIGSGETDLKTLEEESRQQYQIKRGDSLSKIAAEFYGNLDYWPVLARVNSVSNPNLIYTDSEITIPSKEEAEIIKNEMTTTSYQVKEGDTLFVISQKMYGDGTKWYILDRANGSRRLPNGNPLIFAGSTIRVPR